MITAILIDYESDVRLPIKDIKREDKIDSVVLVLRVRQPARFMLASGLDVFDNGALIDRSRFLTRCVKTIDTITITVTLDCLGHPSFKRIQ